MTESLENYKWPPCRAVGDTETTHRIHTVTEHVRYQGLVDPLSWWTACGLPMSSTRKPKRVHEHVRAPLTWRSEPAFNLQAPQRADVLPPNRVITCLDCLAAE